MKGILIIFGLLGYVGLLQAQQVSVDADSAKSKNKVIQSSGSKKDMNLKTSHSFDDYVVQGKFHFGDQVIITVEEDKVLDGLVQVPKHFKDRIRELE